jgi:hypothetical protein
VPVVSSIHREADRRVVVGASVTLDFQLVDAEGEPTAVGSAPTIGIRQADDTVVVAAGTATVSAGGGRYTYTLAARTRPELLAVTWTTGGVGFTQWVEVVGGVLWSVAEAQARDTAFAQGAWTDEQIRSARRRAEDECYALTGRRFVPYYVQATIDPLHSSQTHLILRDWDLRAVRDITEVDDDGVTKTAWTAQELAEVSARESGALVIRGGEYWPHDVSLVVGYEYGLDRAPEAIIDATIRRARYWLTRPTSGILDRASSYTTDAGGTYRLLQPGEMVTGDPEVDAIYARWRRPLLGIA